MTSVRVPVVFPNRKGLRLFGMLHRPAGAANTDLAVLLLSPGVKMRVGPERLYCTMTERMVALGLTVLRFDFYGLGDSEGELTEELMKDVYNHIEVGRFVDDTTDAMDWMARTYGTRRFILSGLCGGAITGLLTAQSDPRVAGLLALAITPVLASRSASPAQYMTSGQLTDVRRTYVTKIFNPKAWLRLLAFQSDYRLLWRTMTHPFKAKLKQSAVTMNGESPAAVPPETDNANPLFPPAFFSMIDSGRPILLVFGGADRLLWEFEEKFVARHKTRLTNGPQCYEVHTVPSANHVLSFEPWQHDMLNAADAWLRRWFGGDVREVSGPSRAQAGQAPAGTPTPAGSPAA